MVLKSSNWAKAHSMREREKEKEDGKEKERERVGQEPVRERKRVSSLYFSNEVHCHHELDHEKERRVKIARR